MPDEVERICSICFQPFRTKWRYARCQPCRYQQSYKNKCACGASKDVRHPQCRACCLGPVRLPPPLDSADTSWVAGLLEAEGTFPLRRTGGGTTRIQMTDEDVIVRFHEILQVGNLGMFTPRNPKHKPSWMLTLARREYIAWLVAQIAPLMSVRRRSAICLLAANFRERIPVPPAIADIGVFPDPQAVAWLAGLIEGDGCIRANEVAVQSVDQDVINRAKQVTECGQIYFSSRQKAHHRDRYAWKLTSRRNIDYVLTAIEPWMLSRRKAAIRTIIPSERKAEDLSLTQ